MKHILSTFCLMAAVAAPVAAQEAAQDTAQAAVQDSARMAAKNDLPDVPMREIKGRVYDNSTKAPAAGVSVSAFNDARYAAMTDETAKAHAYHDAVLPAMAKLRASADAAEEICREDYWPLPCYSRLLYYTE